MREDGEWQVPSGTTYSVFTTTSAGLVPASNGSSTTNFLSQSGSFLSAPEPSASITTAFVTSGSTALVTSGGVFTAINSVADDVADLNTDLSSLGTASLADTTTSVTSGSTALVTSGGVFTAINSVADAVADLNTDLSSLGTASLADTTTSVTSGSRNLVTSGGVHSAISGLTINHVMTDAGTFALNNPNQDMNDATRYFTWNNTVNSLSTGVRHVNNQSQGHGSLFNITKKGEFLISVRLVCTNGLANDRSLIFLELHVNNRNLNNQFTTRGPNVKTYYLESSYYRDDITVDDLVLGGTLRLWLEDNQQFEIVTRRRYSQDPTDTINADTSQSTLFIERHDYTIA